MAGKMRSCSVKSLGRVAVAAWISPATSGARGLLLRSWLAPRRVLGAAMCWRGSRLEALIVV